MKEFSSADFGAAYHKTIDEQDPIYQAFMSLLKNPEEITIYRVLNDQYEIAPADAFCRFHPHLCEKIHLASDDDEKRLLGALFGYLFKFMIDEEHTLYTKTISKRITDPDKRKGNVLYDTRGNKVYLVSASYFKKGK